MLQTLKVENYALISRLELELDGGLNIITGETGAGKTILLGALGLLLGNKGGKSDTEALKDQQQNCLVEGTFDLSGLDLEAFFEENDLDYSVETTLTRQITPAGKSRSFVNDTPVPLATLRDLGTRLIDIHSQHQNLILGSEAFRVHAIDALAENETLLKSYRTHYERVNSLKKEIAALRDASESSRRDQDWLQHQVEELEAAKLKIGEQASLETELDILANADRIGEALTVLCNTLDGDGETEGVLNQLKYNETSLRHVSKHFAFAGEATERLHSVLEELKDLSAEAADRLERIDANPARLQEVDDRLHILNNLVQKHRAANADELLSILTGYRNRLDTIFNGDENLQALVREHAEAEQRTWDLAQQLHEARAAQAPAFGMAIQQTLTQLGMPDARFEVEISRGDTLSPSGADAVNFLFTAAGGKFPPQRVERIASGGELSRVMLALKSLLARHTQLPTIIFDEIDTGVSGYIADAMGDIINSLAATMQVIDITHLPQVASKGNTHFVVYKDAEGSHIRRLTSDERVTEIAKMLSGSTITDAATAQAKILLAQ